MPNHPSFHPAWWLPGAHLPTIWGKMARRIDAAYERVECWPTPDGDTISVARVDAREAGAPTLAVFHGLEGSIRSTYAQGLIQQATQLGWGAALLIFRSCDGRVPAVPRMYHSGETSDADLLIRRLIAERPGAPLVCAGVSLGANVLLKWLGEQGASVPAEVKAAAAVSTPFDLTAGARNLERGFARVYARHFLKSLKRKAMAAIARHPDMPVIPARVAAARTIWEFDDAFTAPVHGFADADDYYRRSSSIHFLSGVAVPTLLLSAEDDPFLPRSVLDKVREVAASNPVLDIDFTPHGGHVGWIAGQPWFPRYEMEQRVADWLADSHE